VGIDDYGVLYGRYGRAENIARGCSIHLLYNPGTLPLKNAAVENSSVMTVPPMRRIFSASGSIQVLAAGGVLGTGGCYLRAAGQMPIELRE
jgi:hypothetical protein